MVSLGRKAQREHKFGAANLSAYLDGELTERERQRLGRHLALCLDCQRELAELRNTVALLRQAPLRPVPRAFALPAAVRPEQARHRRWNATYAFMRAGTVAASFMLAVLLAGEALFGVGAIPLPSALVPPAVPTVEVAEREVIVERVVGEAVTATPPMPAPATQYGRGEGAVEVAREEVVKEEVEKEVTKIVEKEVEKVLKEMVVVKEEVEKEVTKIVEKEEIVIAEAPLPGEAELTLEEKGPSKRSAAATVAGPRPAPPDASADYAAVPAAEAPAAPEQEEVVAPTVREEEGELPVEREVAPRPTPPVAALPTPTLSVAAEPTPPRVAARVGEEPPAVSGPAEARDVPPLSPIWRVWQTIRVLTGVFVGLLFVLLGGLIWSAHKRRA